MLLKKICWKFLFLVADTRLYTLLCRSVGRSVGRSVRRSVGPSVTFLNSEQFLHYCSCPTVRDWIAVYPTIVFMSVYYTFRVRKHIFMNFKKLIRQLVERAVRANKHNEKLSFTSNMRLFCVETGPQSACSSTLKPRNNECQDLARDQ